MLVDNFYCSVEFHTNSDNWILILTICLSSHVLSNNGSGGMSTEVPPHLTPQHADSITSMTIITNNGSNKNSSSITDLSRYEYTPTYTHMYTYTLNLKATYTHIYFAHYRLEIDSNEQSPESIRRISALHKRTWRYIHTLILLLIYSVLVRTLIHTCMNACIYRDAKSDGTHHEVKFADTDHSGEYIHTYIQCICIPIV